MIQYIHHKVDITHRFHKNDKCLHNVERCTCISEVTPNEQVTWLTLYSEVRMCKRRRIHRERNRERESTFLLSLSFWFSLLFPLNLSLSLFLCFTWFFSFLLSFSFHVTLSPAFFPSQHKYIARSVHTRERDTSLYTANIQRERRYSIHVDHTRNRTCLARIIRHGGRKSCWFSNRG